MEEKRNGPQNIILENREKLNVSGVLVVEEFCEE